MNPPIPYLGEMLALLTAIIWSFSLILFKKSGETVHPIALNLFKNVLAVGLIIPTIWLMGDSLFQSCANRDYLLLFLSGVLGIGLADTIAFMSLNLLTAGVFSIVDCMYSPMIIILSVLFLSESLTALQVVGVALIVGAVFTATHEKEDSAPARRQIILGVILGVTALALMGISVVLAKPILDRAPLVWVTGMRLLGGIAILGLITLFHPGRSHIMRTLRFEKGWKYMLPGSFTGAYLSMILWLGGMKYASASVASALNQTSNVFIFLLAAVLLREKITPRRAIGIIVAVIGALVVTFG